MIKISKNISKDNLLKLGRVKGKQFKLIYEGDDPYILIFTCKDLKHDTDNIFLSGRSVWTGETIKGKHYEFILCFIDVSRDKKEVLNTFFHEMIHIVCFIFKGQYPFNHNKRIEEMFASIYGLHVSKIFMNIEKKLK